MSQFGKARSGRDLVQHGFEGFFDIGTTNGLAVTLTAFVEAHVVWMLLACLAFGPAGRQWALAIAAGDEAPQREVRVDILAGRNACAFFDPVLYSLKSLEAHQTFMVPLAQGHTPIRDLDVSCIVRARQKADDFLVAHVAILAFRELRLAFKIAFHFGLGFKTSAGESFKRVLQNACHRLFAHQHLAMACAFLELISGRGMKTPIAVHGPRPHPVLSLLAVVLALMLADRGKQVFNKNRMRILAKLNRRAF